MRMMNGLRGPAIAAKLPGVGRVGGWNDDPSADRRRSAGSLRAALSVVVEPSRIGLQESAREVLREGLASRRGHVAPARLLC